ncbi:hypothetical protein EV363DRAFT_1398220 [Boletus edulis]|nr:hypothetical protein EV363DRAFT_1398220 [Boletus edulis]
MDTTFSQSVIDECADRVGLIFRSHIVARVEGRTLEQQWEEAIELLNTQAVSDLSKDFMRAVITPGVIIPRFFDRPRSSALSTPGALAGLACDHRRGCPGQYRSPMDGLHQPLSRWQQENPRRRPRCLRREAEATQPRPDKGKGKAVAVQDVAETAKPQLKVDKGKGKATAVQDVAKNAKPQPKVDKGKAKAATVAERSDSSQSKVLARTSSKPKEDKGKGKKKQGAEKVPEKQKKKLQTEPEDSEEETRGRSRVRGSPTVEDNRAKSRRGGSRRSPSVPAVPAPSTSNKRRKASKHSRSLPSPPAPLPTSTDEPCERCAKRNTACQTMWKAAHLYKKRRSQSRPPQPTSGLTSQPSTSPRPTAKKPDNRPPPKRAKRNAPRAFRFGPPKRTAVVVPTGRVASKKARGTPAPSTPSSAVQEPDVPVTREEFNRLQEQLQQLKMLSTSVSVSEFSRSEKIRSGFNVGLSSIEVPFRSRQYHLGALHHFSSRQCHHGTLHPSPIAKTRSVRLSPTPRAGHRDYHGSSNAQSRMPPPIAHPPPSQARPSPWLSPCREATPPAEELPVPGPAKPASIREMKKPTAGSLGIRNASLLDYLGDSEDDNMDVVTAEAKEHEV